MKIPTLLFLLVFTVACGRKSWPTNGETIYRTGRNLQGEKLLDKSKSRIKIIGSCKTCHGANGDRMRNLSVKAIALSDPSRFEVPYTDSLFFRFLDHDLKSNGHPAGIGVIWKMSDADKRDLWEYLKRL